MIIDPRAKGGSGSGSTVTWQQIVTGGTEISRITIDGVQQHVYAPEGGSGTVDAEMSSASTNAVQNKVIKEYVDNSIANETARTQNTYTTTAYTEEMELAIAGSLNLKQGKLTAGDNITITSANTISATDTTYVAGAGIEITGNTINCTVSGGGGECNYKIVEALSSITTPTEGLMTFVKARTESQTWNGKQITLTLPFDGQVANIKYGEDIPDQLNYYSGFRTNQIGELTADGAWHITTAYGDNMAYYADNTNGICKIVWEDNTSKDLDLSTASASKTDTSTSISVTYPSNLYRYNSGWKLVDGAYYFDFDSMSQAERAAVYSFITPLVNKVYCYYTSNSINYANLLCKYIGAISNQLIFSFIGTSPNAVTSDGIWNYYLKLTSNGQLTEEYSSIKRYNPSSANLTIDASGNPTGDTNDGYLFGRGLGSGAGSEYMLDTFPIRYDQGNEQYCRGSVTWVIDNGDNTLTFGGTIKINSTVYDGIWTVSMSDRSFTKVSFTVRS